MLLRTFALGLVLFNGFAAPSYAAFTITKLTDMTFPGEPQGSSAQSITTGSSNAASFRVSSSASDTYSITLPSSVTLQNGTHSITVNAFTSNPSGSGITDGSGNQTVYVGATMASISASKTSGTYTGTMTISVDNGPRTRSTTATISAYVYAPITISKVSDLSFGQAAPGDPAKVVDASSGTSRASFTVSGEANSSYTVVLPSDGTVNMTTGAGGANRQIGVNSFTSSPSGSGVLSGTGSQTLYVGATRDAISASQVAGSYSGSFTVTVSY